MIARKHLDAAEPRHAAEIKAPMFLIVGNDDVRAHPKHSRTMRDALEKAGKTVEWMEKDYEGHGYFKEENNRELYTRMLAFFDRYIGAGAKGGDLDILGHEGFCCRPDQRTRSSDGCEAVLQDVQA